MIDLNQILVRKDCLTQSWKPLASETQPGRLKAEYKCTSLCGFSARVYRQCFVKKKKSGIWMIYFWVQGLQLQETGWEKRTNEGAGFKRMIMKFSLMMKIVSLFVVKLFKHYWHRDSIKVYSHKCIFLHLI